MNIAAIRTLVEQHDNHALQQAEADLLEGSAPKIEIQGHDEGEQLTHVLAALWVVQHVKESACSIPDAVRAYTQRIRKSIT